MTLLAKDGAVMAGLPDQLSRVPADANSLVISIGGNDALGYSGVLTAGSHSVADGLEQLGAIRGRFRADYRRTLDAALKRNLPTAVCTIYEPRYPDPVQRRVAATALCLLNDVIVREAAASRVAIIDLRTVCPDDADFANAIEPSAQGGQRIASAIARLVTRPFSQVSAEIVIE